MLKVTAKRLEKMGACSGQVRLFRKLYPRGLEIPKEEGERFRVLTMAAMRHLNVGWYVNRVRLNASYTNSSGTYRRFARGQMHSSGPAMVESNGTVSYYRHGSRMHRVLRGYMNTDTGALVEPNPRVR